MNSKLPCGGLAYVAKYDWEIVGLWVVGVCRDNVYINEHLHENKMKGI